MKLDRKQFSSGIVGAIIGASSVAGINALSSVSHKSKAPMYERVEAVVDGDVLITPKGKKYRSDVVSVGYEPCRKCKP